MPKKKPQRAPMTKEKFLRVSQGTVLSRHVKRVDARIKDVAEEVRGILRHVDHDEQIVQLSVRIEREIKELNTSILALASLAAMKFAADLAEPEQITAPLDEEGAGDGQLES